MFRRHDVDVVRLRTVGSEEIHLARVQSSASGVEPAAIVALHPDLNDSIGLKSRRLALYSVELFSVVNDEVIRGAITEWEGDRIACLGEGTDTHESADVADVGGAHLTGLTAN